MGALLPLGDWIQCKTTEFPWHLTYLVMLVIGFTSKLRGHFLCITALRPLYLPFLPVRGTSPGTSPCEGELKLGLRTSCVQSSMEEQIH